MPSLAGTQKSVETIAAKTYIDDRRSILRTIWPRGSHFMQSRFLLLGFILLASGRGFTFRFSVLLLAFRFYFSLLRETKSEKSYLDPFEYLKKPISFWHILLYDMHSNSIGHQLRHLLPVKVKPCNNCRFNCLSISWKSRSRTSILRIIVRLGHHN